MNPNVLYGVSRLRTTFRHFDGTQVTSEGTGFWLNDNHSPCLVTNRHLFDSNYWTPAEPDFTLETLAVGLHRFDNERQQFLPDFRFVDVPDLSSISFSSDPANDIAALRVKNYPHGYGAFCFGLNDLAQENHFSECIFAGDAIAFIGFPQSWHDERNNLPIVRGGFIASHPKFDYGDAEGRIGGSAVALEAQSFGGSSGSPVLVLEKGLKVGDGLTGGGHVPSRIIGVNAGHIPHLVQDKSGSIIRLEHSGISFAFKSTAILDIIKQLSAT